MPPYCCPGKPPNCGLQPSNRPTPPPGIRMSKWFDPRSPPVLVDWTTMVLPATGPLVKVRLLRVSRSTANQQFTPFGRLVHSRVASAAPAALRCARDGCGSKSVGHIVTDGPRRIVGASVCRAAIATRLDIRIGQGRVVCGTRQDRGGYGSLSRPGTGWLAAIPIASRPA